MTFKIGDFVFLNKKGVGKILTIEIHGYPLDAEGETSEECDSYKIELLSGSGTSFVAIKSAESFLRPIADKKTATQMLDMLRAIPTGTTFPSDFEISSVLKKNNALEHAQMLQRMFGTNSKSYGQRNDSLRLAYIVAGEIAHVLSLDQEGLMTEMKPYYSAT